MCFLLNGQRISYFVANSKVLKENLVTNSTHSSSTNINSNIESSAFNGIEKWKITKKRRKPVTTVGKKVTTIFKSVKPLSRPSEILCQGFNLILQSIQWKIM